MNDLANTLRHDKERTYGTFMVVVGCVIWLLLLGVLVVTAVTKPAGLLPIAIELVVISLVIYFGQCLTRAYIYGHYVMVTPQQFPGLYAMVQDGAKQLGMDEAPTAFVYNSSGVMNAMAVRLVGRRFVWLTSAIIDADTEQQIRFVIGHELGHHAFGHLTPLKRLLKFPGHFIPFLAPAYSRGREFSCDRMGAYLANDLPASLSALQMLASGSARLNETMRSDLFMQQEELVPPIAGFFLKIVSPYPRLTKRVAEVHAYFGTRKTPQSLS